MKAKKSLGQHWLKSEKALAQIVEAAELSVKDTVLEIGPGQGVLTARIIEQAGKVIAIEKDAELVSFLTETFTSALQDKKLQLIHDDILRFNLATHAFALISYKLVANIPYYITGAIIEKFLSTQYQPKRMVLLMQRDVAERIVAKDNKESVLSIAVKAYGAPKIVARVPAGAFVPPPKVESAILVIDNISRKFFTDCDERHFFEVVKFVFGRKRKQIGGSLSEYLGDKTLAQNVLAEQGIAPTNRPENVPLSSWKSLVQRLEK